MPLRTSILHKVCLGHYFLCSLFTVSGLFLQLKKKSVKKYFRMSQLNDKNPFFSNMSKTKKNLGGPQNSELSDAFQLCYVISLNLWVGQTLPFLWVRATINHERNQGKPAYKNVILICSCLWIKGTTVPTAERSSTSPPLDTCKFITTTCRFLVQVPSLCYFCYVGGIGSVSGSSFTPIISRHLHPCVSPQSSTQSLRAESCTGVNGTPSAANSQGRGSSGI